MNVSARSRLSWLAAALLAASVAVAADIPPTAPATLPATRPQLTPEQQALGEKIDALLPQLSAGTFTVRDAARKQLDQLGLPALPLLRQRLPGLHDPEAAARVTARIQALEEEDALNPTLVTLDIKDASIDDVVDALAKAVPFPVNRWPDSGFGGRDAQNLTLHVENQPFWQVIAKISSQQPLRPMFMGGDQTGVRFHIGAAFPHRVVCSGAFAVAATSLNREYHANIDTEPGAEQSGKSFSLSLVVFADPRLNILAPPARAVLLSALDEKGNSLIPKDAPAGPLTSSNNWGNAETSITVPLHYPDNPGATIKTIKGELHALVQTRTETIVFDDLKLKKETRNLHGMEVVLEGFSTRDPNAYDAHIILRPGTMDPDQWKEIHNNTRRGLLVSLLNAQDKLAADCDGYGGGGSEREMSYNYSFSVRNRPALNGAPAKPNPADAPAKLRLELSTKQKEVTIPFEFKDLPLP